MGIKDDLSRNIDRVLYSKKLYQYMVGKRNPRTISKEIAVANILFLSRYEVSRINNKILAKTTIFKNLFSEDYDATTLCVVISSRNALETFLGRKSSENNFAGVSSRTSPTDSPSESRSWVVDTRPDQQPEARQAS